MHVYQSTDTARTNKPEEQLQNTGPLKTFILVARRLASRVKCLKNEKGI